MGKLFGTDGIRATANVYPMVPELALLIGKAAANYFKEHSGNGTPKIVIGKDTRLSGYMIESALTSGIVSMGANVLLVGPMPTPAIAHLTKSLNAEAGIVISASHNPSQDNGIKIFNEDGFKLDEKVEEQIEKLVLEEKMKSVYAPATKIGKAYRIDDAKGRYIEFAKSSIKSESLEGMKIVLDCANGAAYDVAPKIFSELGAKVIVMNSKPDGQNINLNCGATHPQEMQKKVLEEKADLGIALDGDADRVIVSDEKGNFVDGDHIMAICVNNLMEKNRLDENSVVVTVMTNLGFDKAMQKLGVKIFKTAVGDKYVIDEMRKRKIVLGGEQSGHIIFSKYSTTGDGIITALQLLKIMKEKKEKLSKLATIMKSFPQVLVNVCVKEKIEFNEMPSVKKAIQEVEEKLSGNGRTLIRYSGTENLARIMIEGENQKQIEEYANKIAEEIKKEIGI